jgi:hypothetical protein
VEKEKLSLVQIFMIQSLKITCWDCDTPDSCLGAILGIFGKWFNLQKITRLD